MTDDVLPKLLKSVKNAFEKHFGKSDAVAKALAELKTKKATYKTVNEFAIEVGRILSLALTSSISSDKLPDGKMYYNIAKRLLDETLGRNYELISGYAGDVQQVLNEQSKINLKAQYPPMNQDKIDGFVNRLDREPVFDDVKWLFGEPIVNFSQSIVDDCIRANADFHAKTGLTPTIERISTGNCCDWCNRLAGRYIYHEEPPDFYRRHQHCQCIIDYHPKNGKRQNSWSKKWSKETDDVLERRKQMNIDIKDNNRKSDIKEYKEAVSVLGRKAPVSLAKFQDLKYNDDTRYEQLKDKIFVHKKIKSGEWGTKINIDKQLPHNQSTRETGKSYLYDSVDAQKLFEHYYGTGRLETDRYGRRTNVEYIVTDSEVGIAVSRNGQTPTNEIKIHHSKNRAHISPVKKGGIR